MEIFLVIVFIVIPLFYIIWSSSRKKKMLKNGRQYIHPEYPSFTANERFDIHVNGVRYYMKEYIPVAGEGVILKREPTNEYDMDAIAVYNLLKKKIGYIPADYNSDLAEEMDSGKRLSGQVRKSIPRGDDDMEVVIRIVEPIINKS